MIINIKKSFQKDTRDILDRKILIEIGNLIEEIKNCENISQLKDIKKMKGYDNYFRIKLGDYRLGFKYEDNTIIILRILHRKDIYRFFP